MKSFEYAAPQSVEEATELLADAWGETEVIAGGTDLVTALKQHITAPKRVVSLKNISALKGIDTQGDEVRIGAMTTLSDLAGDDTARRLFPSIVTAIEGIGSRQIITVGTVGGDLCQRPRCWYFRTEHGLFGTENGKSLIPDGENRYHAIFGNEGRALFVSPSSLGPALIALGATIAVQGPGDKTRDIEAAAFFRTPKTESERETALEPNEIVTAISIPKRDLRNATYEVRHRRGLDWPYVTASVAFALEGGKASGAQVVLGHVAPTPWPSAKAAQALEGATVDENLCDECAAAAVQGAKPLSQNGYKVHMTRTAVRRAAMSAAGA